ncbi:MAG: chemotaxis protein CheA [Gammaproteobacteria bacterium]
MNLDAAVQMFHAESDELLQRMESTLLQLQSSPQRTEVVDELFRAVHTIKGTAGIFGYDAIVAFTHDVETLLDRIRCGEDAADADVVSLLLACGDHIRALIAPAMQGTPIDAELAARGAQLTARVLARCGAPAGRTPAPPDSTPPAAADVSRAPQRWRLRLRFGPEVLRNGMDPLSILRYLATFGEIEPLQTLTDRMPPWEEMDPEACHLGFDLVFASAAGREAVDAAFDFVRADCEILIEPLDGGCAGDSAAGAGIAATGTEADAPAAQAAGTDAPGPAREPADARRAAPRSLRIDAGKLDQLIDVVGEIVIAGAGLQLSIQRSGQPDLVEQSEALARLVEEVRNSALALRMVPIGASLHRFQRVVHDLGRELGKDVSLAIEGADTELDKSIVEAIADPLTHLVRNALDHGIEAPRERRARGKPARASLRLSARHDSGSIVIEVGDDGAGLDRERILAKAIGRGLVASGDALTDREVYRLIFAPGLSTADKVSNLSGRGVGMDVVKRSIEALRGSVDIESEPGAGTTVRIRLPLTLAIIDGLLVGIGQARYVIPLDSVHECIEIGAAERAAAAARGYIDLRGTVLPLLWLRERFACGGPPPPRRENIVVIHHGGNCLGVVVDDLYGNTQTVIRPMSEVFRHLDCFSGSTILGDGGVALILDVAGLADLARGPVARGSQAA